MIGAEEIYVKNANTAKSVQEVMIEFAMLHVKAALEAAAEKVKLKEFRTTPQDQDSISNDMGDIYGVDKQSILNAYPEDLIK